AQDDDGDREHGADPEEPSIQPDVIAVLVSAVLDVLVSAVLDVLVTHDRQLSVGDRGATVVLRARGRPGGEPGRSPPPGPASPFRGWRARTGAWWRRSGRRRRAGSPRVPSAGAPGASAGRGTRRSRGQESPSASGSGRGRGGPCAARGLR